MVWIWTAARSVWITASPSDRTLLHRACTWAGLLTPRVTAAAIEAIEVGGDGGEEEVVAGETGEEVRHLVITTITVVPRLDITTTEARLPGLMMTVAVTATTAEVLTVTAALHPDITTTAGRHHVTMKTGVMEAAAGTMRTAAMRTAAGGVGPTGTAGTGTWTTGTGDPVMEQGGLGPPARTTGNKDPDETTGAGAGHTRGRDTKTERAEVILEHSFYIWNCPRLL